MKLQDKGIKVGFFRIFSDMKDTDFMRFVSDSAVDKLFVFKDWNPFFGIGFIRDNLIDF